MNKCSPSSTSTIATTSRLDQSIRLEQARINASSSHERRRNRCATVIASAFREKRSLLCYFISFGLIFLFLFCNQHDFSTRQHCVPTQTLNWINITISIRNTTPSTPSTTTNRSTNSTTQTHETIDIARRQQLRQNNANVIYKNVVNKLQRKAQQNINNANNNNDAIDDINQKLPDDIAVSSIFVFEIKKLIFNLIIQVEQLKRSQFWQELQYSSSNQQTQTGAMSSAQVPT